ncbi:MAG: hypothetical protein ABI238_07080, partial [Terrimesophilobacter sp.]
MSRFTPTLTTVLVLVGVALVAIVAIVVLAPRVGIPELGLSTTPGPDYALTVDPPPVAADPPARGIAGLVDAAWVARVSAASGIPARALAAYAGAAI